MYFPINMDAIIMIPYKTIHVKNAADNPCNIMSIVVHITSIAVTPYRKKNEDENIKKDLQSSLDHPVQDIRSVGRNFIISSYKYLTVMVSGSLSFDAAADFLFST